MRIDGATANRLRPWFPDLDMQSVVLVHGGPVCWFVRSVIRQGAMTVAPYVFYGRSSFDATRVESVALLAHELKHVQQYRELGRLGFLVRYFVAKARNGFRYSEDLPLEKDAYALQREVENSLTIS
ncbi:MAG TPA: DUF4157 domain-containing protein [Dehalococcoidia bacterium]|jgi:hypothetical protein|nr:DUF4157 domain-containing protein [Dehalococcoidia bacterium]